jgi:hypothetical protein
MRSPAPLKERKGRREGWKEGRQEVRNKRKKIRSNMSKVT